MRRRKAKQPPERPQEPLSAPESGQTPFVPFFPKAKLTEAPTGLLVVKERLSVEERAQRRADNKRMKEIHGKVRRRRKHGR